MISATVLAPTAAAADALATAAYVLGPTGLAEIVRAGPDVGAMIVLPAPGGGLRVVLANLAAGAVSLESEPGLEVTQSEAAPET